MSIEVIVAQVERDGFALLPGVFTPAQADAMLDGLGPALSDPPPGHESMRSETRTQKEERQDAEEQDEQRENGENGEG